MINTVINSEANLADGACLLEKHTKRRKVADLIINQNSISQGIDGGGGNTPMIAEKVAERFLPGEDNW
jgi:hypothetical protein